MTNNIETPIISGDESDGQCSNDDIDDLVEVQNPWFMGKAIRMEVEQDKGMVQTLFEDYTENKKQSKAKPRNRTKGRAGERS